MDAHITIVLARGAIEAEDECTGLLRDLTSVSVITLGFCHGGGEV